MSVPARLPPAEITHLTLGYMRLSDAAPLILAKEAGLFEQYGLDVTLHREVSWANLRDKLVVGELDAAQLLAPLPMTTTFGAGGLRGNLLTGLSLAWLANLMLLTTIEPWLAILREGAGAAGAVGGDFDLDGAGGAGGVDRDIGREAEGDRRDDVEAAAFFRGSGAGDGEGFGGDDELLAADFEDEFERHGREIFRGADEGGVIDAGEAGIRSSGSYKVFKDPKQACAGADLVTTDVWTSMGFEAENEARQKAFADWCVDTQMMSLAQKDALFMHCLPAHRGEEVEAEVIDGPQSVVWDEAENRMHVQKALMEFLLLGRLA